ncbi:MAG: tetratricopeptide repeat protein [Sandaracinus sp.]
MVDARRRVTRGEALFERGDFDAALAEFERAYEEIGEHPSRFLVLYNIAQCHERRFRYDVALSYYRRYLDEGGRTEEGHAEVEANVGTLEELLSTVSVSTSAPHASTFVDGRRVGEAPGDVRVPAGLHVLSVRADGYVPAEQELEVPAAGTLALALEPTRLSDTYYGISPLYSLGFAALGLGALGAGIGFGVGALEERRALDASIAADPMAWSDASRTSIQVHADSIRSQAMIADVLYGTAGVLGLTAIVLGVLGDWSFGARAADEARQRSAHGVSVSLRLGPGALAIGGSF